MTKEEAAIVIRLANSAGHFTDCKQQISGLCTCGSAGECAQALHDVRELLEEQGYGYKRGTLKL